ncbi:MAG TPA: hypothetical protein VFH89_11215 [Sphingomicrobium sp.]|nr:hypothetical protein [Sphingomicrobium sp.]
MSIAGSANAAQTDGAQTPNWLTWMLVAGILLSVAVQAWLAFVHRFNGDEFFFLLHVHNYLRGTLHEPLQTFQVHLFTGLASLPTETEQLIAGRIVALAFEIWALASLYALSRAWAGKAAALFAVLCFATMLLTLQHGASFRADPLALAPTIAALSLLARSDLRSLSIAAMAFLAALAVLVTVKVIFFAPAFAAIAAWRLAVSTQRRQTVVALGITASTTLLVAALLYFFHRSTLAAAAVSNSGKMLGNAGSTMFLGGGFLPGRIELLFMAITSPLQVLLLLVSIASLTLSLARSSPQDRWQGVAILGCVAPLCSLLFYRNSFVYFLPFILAPSFVVVAWFVDQRKWAPGILAILTLGLLVTGAIPLPRVAANDQTAQRATIRAVHQAFPRPVPYIDRSGMIASFPKQGFFMSTWGMIGYQQRAPEFEAILRQRPVPLLIANSPALEHALGLKGVLAPNLRLSAVDEQVLRENYVPHWGLLWVAGKRIRLGSGKTPTTILIPGIYTVEGASVRLDGHAFKPGDTIRLTRGTQQFSGTPGSQLTLRWGNHLLRPAQNPPTMEPVAGF